jgi:5-deoxy-D-glucuronate isomerase
MATVPHVTSGSELRKFQADGFLFDRVYSVTSRRVLATTVTVGKEQVLHIPSVCL